MRSIITIQTRNSLRNALKTKHKASYAAIRFSSSESRKWSTPLAKQLSEAITATGPIPLASFMRMCLTSDIGGYYTTPLGDRDQFGQKGDFITSPEISQIFGELVGIWFVAEWMAQGRKKGGVEFIEIGPGRGTLMDDMLRTIRNFKPLAESIEAVYMVEASPALRETQKQLLCGNAPLHETSIGYQSVSKYANIPVIWTENIRFIPPGENKTPFIVAHEFFDALPIHAFQSIPAPPPAPEQMTIKTPTGEHTLTSPPPKPTQTQKGPQWRELVVSPTPPSLSISQPGEKEKEKETPEFHLTLSQAPTPHSLYLPYISPRYKPLLSTPGSLIEISPDSLAYASSIATLIGGSTSQNKTTLSPAPTITPLQITKPHPSGAALILDYGPSHTIPLNSLRGIQAHKYVSPFSTPGLTDLSCDVDFTGLAEAALNASEGVEVHGPVDQGAFLEAMGIRERGEILVKSLDVKGGVSGKEGKETEKIEAEIKKRVEGAWKRLIDRGGSGMGKVYKVMAIVPESGGRRPVGFGGDVGA